MIVQEIENMKADGQITGYFDVFGVTNHDELKEICRKTVRQFLCFQILPDVEYESEEMSVGNKIGYRVYYKVIVKKQASLVEVPL